MTSRIVLCRCTGGEKKWELIRLSPDLDRMNNCRTGGNAPFSVAVVNGD